MIKKIVLTLFLLIVLVVAGIVTLIVFVDPNNFKGFISNTIKDKTGYELTLEGDLRWHIWPQISLLTDAVQLADQGAKNPILTADNMRLDVELLPLFSKELVVKNVLVKSAVINLTDESKGKNAQDMQPTATINQAQAPATTEPQAQATSWKFALNQLDIIDSTVLWQQDTSIISFRNIDISVAQKGENNLALTFNGSINRDQQDFIYALNADIRLDNFPKQAVIDLKKLSYDYKGIGVPAGQIKGTVTGTVNFQKSPLVIHSNNLVMTINDNTLNAKLKANLAKKPYFEAIVSSEQLDVTPFMASNNGTNSNSTSQSPSAPVVSKVATKNGNELDFLQQFDAKLQVTVKRIMANKLLADNFMLNSTIKNGIAELSNISFDIAQGTIKANGTANGKQTSTLVNLFTKIDNIDLGVLFSQLELSNYFKGTLNAQGNVTTTTIQPEKISAAVMGKLDVEVNDARFENINIQNIIQNTVAQYTKDVATAENQQKYTEFETLSAQATIANGDMMLNSIKALSQTIDATGNGRVGLVKQDIDVNLLVKMLGGWNGKSDTIAKLQKVELPLRIYGPFAELHYQVNIEKIIRDLLSSKLQQGLDRLKDQLQKDNESDNKDNKVSEILDNLFK